MKIYNFPALHGKLTLIVQQNMNLYISHHFSCVVYHSVIVCVPFIYCHAMFSNKLEQGSSFLPGYPASSCKPQTPAPRPATWGVWSPRHAQSTVAGICTQQGPASPGYQVLQHWLGCAPGNTHKHIVPQSNSVTDTIMSHAEGSFVLGICCALISNAQRVGILPESNSITSSL